MNKPIRFNPDFLRYLGTASVMAVLLSLNYVIKHKALAFHVDDIGADLYYQFYALQMGIVRQLHTLHYVTWSSDLGLGTFLGLYFNPIQILLTFFLPESTQFSARLPIYFIELVLAGSFFFAYLRTAGFEGRFASIGALCYAFSGFSMLDAQWDMTTLQVLQLAAYLYFLERFLQTQNRWLAAAAGFTVASGAAFDLYQFAVFTLLYACVPFAAMSSRNIRTTFITLVRGTPWIVAGAMLLAFVQIPNLHYLFDSPRVTGNYANFGNVLHTVFHINDRATLSAELAGFVGKGLLGSNFHYYGWNNYFEGPGFYVGILPLLCIPQLFAPQASRRERRVLLLGLLTITFYVLSPAIRDIACAMNAPYFRFSSFWISVLLLMLGLAGLRRAAETGIWRVGVMIGTLFPLTIVIGALLLNPDHTDIEHVIRVTGFALLYAAILIAIFEAGTNARVLHLLGAIIALELALFAIAPIVERDAVSTTPTADDRGYNDGTDQALEYVRQYQRQFSGNDDFYRIDKTYYSVFLNDSLVQGYPGTASYFYHGVSITRFEDTLEIPRIAQSSNYNSSVAVTGHRDMLDLLGVRYVLARDRNLDKARDMAFVSSVGDINIYRNDTARSFGSFYNSFASEAEAKSVPVALRDSFLLQHVVVVDPATLSARLAGFPDSSAAQGKEQNAHIHKVRDDLLTGSVQTPVASTLLLSMPFDRGWTLQVDGQATETFVADYGLTAAVIAPGTHKVTLRYEPPGRRIGQWLSLASLVTLLTALLLRRRKRAPGTSSTT